MGRRFESYRTHQIFEVVTAAKSYGLLRYGKRPLAVGPRFRPLFLALRARGGASTDAAARVAIPFRRSWRTMLVRGNRLRAECHRSETNRQRGGNSTGTGHCCGDVPRVLR